MIGNPMSPEERVISKLRASSFDIDDDKRVTLEDFFRELRKTSQQVSDASPTELYEAQWALLGIVSRSYQLMLCSIDQIAGGNWNGFYAATRALAETLCSIVWASEAPERLVALVATDQRGAGKMLNAGYRKYPDLKETYTFFSRIVHPNRDSHLLNIQPVAKPGEVRIASPFTLGFSDYFAVQKVALLVKLGSDINQELTDLLVRYPDIAKRGRVMARIVNNSH